MADSIYQIQGESLNQSLETARLLVKNLSKPLRAIGEDWIETNKETFNLSGPGPYPDLATAYKAQKQRRHGFTYPILRATGRLERSLTRTSGTDTIFKVTKRELTIGTKVPYGFFHQKGTSKMPRRPFLFIGGPFAVGKQKGRARRWLGILDRLIVERLAKL